MSITAKELAAKLNLSAAAVSMALNGKPGVSTQTRKLVQDAAEKYGFDFTKIAEKHNVIGSIYFVIFKKHGAIVNDTPFFSQVSEGVFEACKSAGYKLNVRYLYGDDERDTLEQLEEIQFSDCIGILLLGTEMTPEDLKHFQQLPIPFIILDTYFESVSANYVLINNVQGAYLATSHLIKKTKKQPGYLHSSYSIGNFEERNSGFFKAIRAYGMSSRQSIVHTLTPSIEGSYADMKEILENKDELASCYFADNDLIAIGCMKALKEYGYSIPKDIAIVGFDNIPFSRIMEPSLTTINVPKQYMGEIAVNRLITLLTQKGEQPVKIEISTQLIERNSV